MASVLAQKFSNVSFTGSRLTVYRLLMSAEGNPNGHPPADYDTLVEQVKSALAATEEQQKRSTHLLDEVQSVSTLAVAARTQITDQQAIIATKSDHIQKAQEHADKVRADLDRALTAANQQVTATESHAARANESADESAEILTELKAAKTQCDSLTSAITTAKKEAEDATVVSKKLADKAEEVDDRIEEYEKRLAELEKQCEAQLQTITDLLPGATSVGLAHSFDKRRQTFLRPQLLWQVVFVGSVALIVLLAGSGLIQAMLNKQIATYYPVHN